MLIERGKPAVVLAPMEGVTDAPMRALMSERGGFTFCVTEFLRISQDLPSTKALREHIPELNTECKTPTGTPVQVQFLGGHPEKLAEASLRAVQAGALGIDLNFGCPAPTVNRNDGGATLLKHPDRIRTIVSTVRNAVPSNIPVSAKLRLGWDNIEDIHHNSEMAAQGGANWLTIHGRTKTQGYQPPAYWKPIGEVQRRLGLPVVANGEIWTLEDFHRCREQTRSEHYMIGRSALADPALPFILGRELGLYKNEIPKNDWVSLFHRLTDLCAPYSRNPNYPLRRIKQWMGMISHKFPHPHWIELRRVNTLPEVFNFLETHSF